MRTSFYQPLFLKIFMLGMIGFLLATNRLIKTTHSINIQIIKNDKKYKAGEGNAECFDVPASRRRSDRRTLYAVRRSAWWCSSRSRESRPPRTSSISPVLDGTRWWTVAIEQRPWKNAIFFERKFQKIIWIHRKFKVLVVWSVKAWTKQAFTD